MDIQKIFAESVRLWNTATPADLVAAERFGAGAQAPFENLLLPGDNLALLAALAERRGAGELRAVQLFYMDPPYYSNRDYSSKIRMPDGDVAEECHAFSDTWTGGHEAGLARYLGMLTPRLIAARELLADDGCLWLHLDRHAVHYVKVLADLVFGGPEHLINEVIWTYKSGGASQKRFACKHDNLLFYAKRSQGYKFFAQQEKSYNRELKPYRFKGVEEFRDELGWYTMVNMKDVWEIPMVGRTAQERTGYATQKPEALLERIVSACTEIGDLCCDPFCGSGTLPVVCERLGRRWIGIDSNAEALDVAAGRLRALAEGSGGECVPVHTAMDGLRRCASDRGGDKRASE